MRSRANTPIKKVKPQSFILRESQADSQVFDFSADSSSHSQLHAHAEDADEAAMWEAGDWNFRFQALMNELRSTNIGDFRRAELFEELLILSRDFINAAKIYGRIIISERYLRVHNGDIQTPRSMSNSSMNMYKTINPIDLGGLCGGEKFIVSNILFKFAVDEHNILGSDRAAAKVAGHELVGHTAYFNLGIPGLCLPLMALVDYMGFRLIAMSLLPISRSTLVYGTANGGETVFASDKMFNRLMRSAGEQLHVAPHICGMHEDYSVRLWAAADIEGHVGSDGQYYLVDLARTLPPMGVSFSKESRGHLFQMLRPELVDAYAKPLCPDAFSGFVRHDPERAKYNADVEAATHHLFRTVIPNAAQELKWTVLEAVGQSRVDSVDVAQILHRSGVNLRLIGQVLHHIDQRPVRLLLFLEAYARILKIEIRQLLRRKMAQVRLPLEAPYHDLLVSFFNHVFAGQRTPYWEESFSKHAEQWFGIDSFDPDGQEYTLAEELAGSQDAVPRRPASTSTSSPTNSYSSATNNSDSADETLSDSGYSTAKLPVSPSPPSSSPLEGSNGSLYNSPICAYLPPASKAQRTKKPRGSVRPYALLSQTVEGSTQTFRSLLIRKVAALTGLQLTPHAEEAISGRKSFSTLHFAALQLKVKHIGIVTNAEAHYLFHRATRASRQHAVALFTEAAACYDRALQHSPNDWEILLNAAECWFRIFAAKEHGGVALASVTLDPRHPLAIHIEQYYFRALKSSPENPYIRLKYANFLARCGLDRQLKAEHQYLRALKNDPNYVDGLNDYGLFLRERCQQHNIADQFETRASRIRQLQYADTRPSTLPIASSSSPPPVEASSSEEVASAATTVEPISANPDSLAPQTKEDSENEELITASTPHSGSKTKIDAILAEWSGGLINSAVDDLEISN